MFRQLWMAMAAWLGLEQRHDEITGEQPGVDGSNRDGERRSGWIATSTNRWERCELRKSREGVAVKIGRELDGEANRQLKEKAWKLDFAQRIVKLFVYSNWISDTNSFDSRVTERRAEEEGGAAPALFTQQRPWRDPASVLMEQNVRERENGEQSEMDSVMFRQLWMAMAAWLGLEQRHDEITGEQPGVDGSNRDGERRSGWIATSTNRWERCELRKSREGVAVKIGRELDGEANRVRETRGKWSSRIILRIFSF
ncbi:hypothetical protein SASPL_117892 [Salvia splendens]|uniref:Uncharacterized protein n=1 Tax=Salvia splendens TaxID=180675 RepID=A0A8X8XVT0_SALSN|nr:hypothetical protein SASPL_117892 [Salvia splendens]